MDLTIQCRIDCTVDMVCVVEWSSVSVVFFDLEHAVTLLYAARCNSATFVMPSNPLTV